MKVILKQDVKGLGKKGQMVTVAEGYGRNYLLPRGLAMEASEGAMKAVRNEQLTQKAKEDRAVREAREVRDKIHGQTITLKAKVGEGGRLFGSVTSKDVAEALTHHLRTEVDRKRVELKDPIKALGTYSVTVRLGHDQTAQVSVQVVEA